MPDRRTQSYAAVPREFDGAFHRALRRSVQVIGVGVPVDPEDPVPELPPSPTFWPRDEPKEPRS